MFNGMPLWRPLLSFICYILSAIIFSVLGVKFQLGSFEEKAEYRKVFLLYIGVGLALTLAGIILNPTPITNHIAIFIFGVGLGLVSSTWVVIKDFFSIRKVIMDFMEKKFPFLTAEVNDLVARLLKEKNKKNLITYSSLFLSFVAEYVIYRKTPEISMLIAMVLTLALLALCFANQQILYYRLKCGLYGTCPSEAREIIAYVMEQMKNKDNSGGGLPKLVFKEEELVERVLRTDGGEEYAG